MVVFALFPTAIANFTGHEIKNYHVFAKQRMTFLVTTAFATIVWEVEKFFLTSVWGLVYEPVASPG